VVVPGRRRRLRGAALKADPSAQLELLELQDLDTRHDTVQHRLRTLPEIARLKELDEQRSRLDGRVRDLRVAVSDLTEEQSRADADVEQVKARRERDQGLVDAGSVSDPKALERMLGELESLQRRIATLEDVELDVMQRLEDTQAELDAHEIELGKVDDEIAQVRAARDVKVRDFEQEAAELQAERGQVAAKVPDELLALYEKLRAQKGGVGAAALRRKECEGCRLAINTIELARIAKAPADEVIRCEECGRILVRTQESGL